MQVVLKAAIFALIAIATASMVFAQPPGGPGGQRQGGPGGGGHGGNDPGRAVLMALDTDGDHEISADEIKYSSAALTTLDSNGDGKLTLADLAGGNENRNGAQRRQRGGPQMGGPQMGGQQGGRPGPPPEQGGPGHGQGPPSPEQMVKHAMDFDADKDGKLDSAELLKFAQQLGPPPGGPGAQNGGNGQQRPDRPAR